MCPAPFGRRGIFLLALQLVICLLLGWLVQQRKQFQLWAYIYFSSIAIKG